MATGVPAKIANKKKKVPIYVSYEGKKNEEEVLSASFQEYLFQQRINGKGDNQFYFGDNLDVLLFLRNTELRGKIKLVYIDPPFSTESDFVNRKQKHAYSDNLTGGDFVEFLRERILLLYDLLANDGSMYVHLDGKMAFTMKLIMDEIFGENNCRAFITRKKCSTKNYTKNTYGNISDYIMFYTKTANYVWNRPYEDWDDENMLQQYPCVDEKTGKRYKKVPVHAPGVRNGETGKEWKGMMPPKGKHWQYTPQKLDELDAAGEIYWSPSGNPRRKVFLDPTKGIPVQDIWLDYRDSINQAQKTTGYPTEKNLDMLKLIVEASSNEGDIVLDCFAGSGTTLDAAFQCKRKWIGVDNSEESLKAILKRFTTGLEEYGDYVNKKEYKQYSLTDLLVEKCPFDIFTNQESNELVKNICCNKTFVME